ncbi:class I histocompatibility antigen, F10 alpha chain-like isoform X2 [Phaenicophaeus curvirostris]
MELSLVLGLVPLLFLGALGCRGRHSLHYYGMGVSKPSPGLSEFVSLGYVDGNLISRYDSETGKTVPKADWVKDNLDEQHWYTQTQRAKDNQEFYHMCLDRMKSIYNQSGGAHTLQRRYGCDLEDGSITGFYRSAYDGKDFIAFDMATMTFTVWDTVAEVTKRQWEEEGRKAKQWKDFLENTCIKWLRKYLRYGQAVLERKELPMVQVSGKEAKGILTLCCRVYGFYPRPIAVSWLKGGEVRDQDTVWSSIAPNSDGTYYISASIDIHPEEKHKYQCRVEHASLAQPGLFAWDEHSGLGRMKRDSGVVHLLTPEMESNLVTTVLAVAAAVILAVTAVIAGFAFWKYKLSKVPGQ